MHNDRYNSAEKIEAAYKVLGRDIWTFVNEISQLKPGSRGVDRAVYDRAQLRANAMGVADDLTPEQLAKKNAWRTIAGEFQHTYLSNSSSLLPVLRSIVKRQA